MVTVIADKEELTTPVNNGVTGSSNDNERPFQYIKDYQEVDFHRSASCKPLPEDLFGINDGQKAKSSIQGTFFVQVDGIEPIVKFSNNNNNQIEQTNDNNSLLLTLSDGITTVKGITNDYIHDLSFNVRPGCKLLLTGVIPINDGLLQLTHDNTRFQYGSNTYPRPRSAYRGRGGGGSYRPSYEGRRGGGNGNSNTRYDNDDGESNFFKRPPPKNTLMDFMTSLKISDDIKQPIDNENQKFKDRNDNKRRNNEQYYKTSNGVNTTNTLTTSNPNHYYQANNNNNATNQITFHQDGINEQLDSEDDPSHSNYRERRNPLPPRLQRAQEERSRRNTNRYYDESGALIGGEINGNYRNSTTNNHSLSSSSTYLRHGDQTTYIPNNSSTGQQHATTLNSYAPHANMLAAVNSSPQTHLAYYQTNPGALAYSLAGIPSPPFHSQQPPIGPSYTNDHLTFCYGAPYATPTYLPPSVTNGFNGDSKNYNQNNPSVIQGNSFVDETEGTTTTTATNESHQDDNNDIENKSQTSSNEQKATSISSNDDTNNSQQVINEQSEDKSRDLTSNPRPRWKIGDVCLARWSEDREFYIANIVQIQSSYCTVLFRDYNNYDRVHFSDLKMLPRDQQFYPFVQPVVAPSSELNALAASAYFPPRPNYYPSPMDGCIMMPEAPPFPFNSAGTLYMCPPPMTSVPRSNRYNTNCFQQPTRRVENGSINNPNPNGDTTISSSSTPPSKDSNDTSIIDSTTTSNDDNHQSSLTRDIKLCSIADAPLTLVTKDDERQRSTSTESLTSSKDDEQPTTNEAEEEEKQENNSVINAV